MKEKLNNGKTTILICTAMALLLLGGDYNNLSMLSKFIILPGAAIVIIGSIFSYFRGKKKEQADLDS